jgi:hypothetical protein
MFLTFSSYQYKYQYLALLMKLTIDKCGWFAEILYYPVLKLWRYNIRITKAQFSAAEIGYISRVWIKLLAYFELHN